MSLKIEIRFFGNFPLRFGTVKWNSLFYLFSILIERVSNSGKWNGMSIENLVNLIENSVFFCFRILRIVANKMVPDETMTCTNFCSESFFRGKKLERFILEKVISFDKKRTYFYVCMSFKVKKLERFCNVKSYFILYKTHLLSCVSF
jgi:hypothetical protein